MLYILCALKIEAQAFVDKYKLSKTKLREFTLYSNSKILLIVSGVGVQKARKATQTLIDYFDITDKDIYLNVGICGASKEYEISQVIEIGTIIYKNQKYSFKDASTLVCVDTPSEDISKRIVDMESYGFYDAVVHSTAIKSFYIFKIVSDHFEPNKVLKEQVKNLIFNQINAINKIIFSKEKN